MEPTPSCPRCGRPTVLRGHVIDGSQSSLSGPRFLPEQVQPKVFTDSWWGVEVERRFLGCLSCGLVWSGLDANRLHAFVQQHGAEIDRQQLDEWDAGPMRGLPDTAPARAAVAHAAEIDRLVRARLDADATRRYRELTGVTWDQAVAAIRTWRDLKRDAKLARFGAVAKKGIVDDLAEPLL